MENTPTPLQKLRHKKAWTLSQLYLKLREAETPISFPTLILLDHGYRSKVIRDENGKISRKEKLPYTPNPRTLADIARLFNVKPSAVYEDRSKQ